MIAASAGNHAQGVAWAARHFQPPAYVVVPGGAPRTKTDGCRALKANVIEYGTCYEDAEAHASTLAETNDWRFLHAFDDPEVIAGQGTVAIELLAQDLDLVLVPIGGGGLAAGMSLVLAANGIRTVGVQVEGVHAMARAFHGEEGPFVPDPTMADGLRMPVPGERR